MSQEPGRHRTVSFSCFFQLASRSPCTGARLIAPQFATFSEVEAHCLRGGRLAPRSLLQSNCGIRRKFAFANFETLSSIPARTHFVIGTSLGSGRRHAKPGLVFYREQARRHRVKLAIPNGRRDLGASAARPLRNFDVFARRLGESKQNSYSIKTAPGSIRRFNIHEFFRPIHS